MFGMTEDEAYAQALAWLKILEGNVTRIADDHRIWQDVQAIIASNPALHRPSIFYRWMQDMYVAGTAMAIRRLVDNHPQAVSFVRLLRLIQQHPGVVSRARYRKLFDQSDADVDKGGSRSLAYADRCYDALVRLGAEVPDSKDIQAQIMVLRRSTKRFTVFANKVVAHTDEEEPTTLPKYSEIDVAIEAFGKLLNQYIALTRAATLRIGSVPQYSWKAIFRVPWLPPT